MTSASLSAFDPTLIDGVRDQLAEDFAQRIFDAIPDISDCIEFEADACDNAAGKKRFERASQLLYSRRRDLQSQTAVVIRRIFDERLFRLLDGTGRIALLSLDSMTLLADERLDEEIAINSCSRRLKEQCEYELWGLTRRLIILTGMNHPSDSQNPVFPQTFAQALMEAIGSFETNAGVRLVVFKTFGPVLLDIVPAIFAAANIALKAHGIDVESAEYYGRPVLTPERQLASLPTQQEIALGATKINLELTSALTQILAKSASSLAISTGRRADQSSIKLMGTSARPPLVQPEESAEPAWRGDLRDIEAGIAHELIDQSPGWRTLHGARRALHEKLTRDEQVIGDIVTVMFDRLLVDARMPSQLRETVARLQLPVLELALKDRSLLTQVHHPVRKLLDLIAEFGLTLGLGDDDDSTVRSVENIIDGLVQIRNEEPSAFKLAFERLDNFFYHHEEAALQNDNNLRALERQEAVEFASSQADREIALRLQNITLPIAISAFILTAWREVLVHNYLHGGPMGEPCKLSLATLDDIVKSLRPSTDETERRRLIKLLPAFIKSLLDIAITAGDQDVVIESFFNELQRAHQLSIAGKWAEIGGERFISSPAALAVSSSVASPSVSLAALGLACGDWIETRDVSGIRRWRLNWITSILGTCVFKHYETNTTRNMNCEELRARLSSGEVQRVRGLGLVDEVLNGAFATVSRKARREKSLSVMRVPTIAGNGAFIMDIMQQ